MVCNRELGGLRVLGTGSVQGLCVHHHVLVLAQHLHSFLYNCLKSSRFVLDIMR